MSFNLQNNHLTTKNERETSESNKKYEKKHTGNSLNSKKIPLILIGFQMDLEILSANEIEPIIGD